MNKLKAKWGIKSNWHLVLIFFVFSVTGSLSIYVKAFIFTVVGVDASTSWFLIIPFYVVTIIPIYYTLLIIVGSLLGQYRFFLAFEKKSLGRLFLRKKSV